MRIKLTDLELLSLIGAVKTALFSIQMDRLNPPPLGRSELDKKTLDVAEDNLTHLLPRLLDLAEKIEKTGP